MNTPTQQQIEAALNYADCEETTGGIRTRMTLRTLAAAYREQQREIAIINGCTERWAQRCLQARQQRDTLAEALREIYNTSSFDYDTMPEASRKKYREIIISMSDNALATLKGEA